MKGSNLIDKECDQCRVLMVGVYHTRRYCRDCSWERQSKLALEHNRRPKSCKICGDDTVSGNKYCSQACRSRAKSHDYYYSTSSPRDTSCDGSGYF